MRLFLGVASFLLFGCFSLLSIDGVVRLAVMVACVAFFNSFLQPHCVLDCVLLLWFLSPIGLLCSSYLVLLFPVSLYSPFLFSLLHHIFLSVFCHLLHMNCFLCVV